MTTLSYRVYMRSPLWRARRAVWFRFSAKRCEDCGRRLVLHRRDVPYLGLHQGPVSVLTVHHVTYKRLWRERRRDVALLCWSCHCRREPWKRRAGGA